MMLKKSSTTTTTPIAASKQTLLPISSSYLNSPRNFTTFITSKGSNDSESFLISPTSILDSKSSSSSCFSSYPFCCYDITPKGDDSKVQWKKLDDSKSGGGVGLGILDADSSKKSKTKSPAVLFSSKLKIEIPSFSSSSSIVSFINDDDSLLLKSPSDFGIKTRNSAVLGLEKSNSQQQQQRVLSGLSITEMENLEEYTCVVSHGPNPKTIHIFDDCVIDSCYYGTEGSSSVNEKESFLSFCYNCKKNLNQGNDIYIYRGEKAFCNSDCRYKEMDKDNLSLC